MDYGNTRGEELLEKYIAELMTLAILYQYTVMGRVWKQKIGLKVKGCVEIPV